VGDRDGHCGFDERTTAKDSSMSAEYCHGRVGDRDSQWYVFAGWVGSSKTHSSTHTEIRHGRVGGRDGSMVLPSLD